jgi:hypothetical protein
MTNGNTEKLNMALQVLRDSSDDDLAGLQFSMPWQMDEANQSTGKDADGFGTATSISSSASREELQKACWNKFNESPQVGTAVKGQVGRLTGLGFEVSSEVFDIQTVLEEIEFDPRNRLYSFWPKYVARSIIEGELFICLTLHDDGFVELDFIDPSNVGGGGEDGVIYHPSKVTMPLFYFIKQEDANNVKNARVELVPSIFIARYPELVKVARTACPGYSDDFTKASRSSKAKYKGVGGFRRFIVSWDKGFVTKRNVSYLRTILEWLNYYENLKKYEIDHKKSAGSYLWVVSMTDPKAFRTWLSLSDVERAKTGIMAKKTPGGTIVLPPGMTMECRNPTLPTISESDTDIFHMITSGLNEPEDVTSGQSKGTFASVKSSRGPMNDRIADEICAFEKFLRHDFYSGIFFLKSKASAFPATFKTKVAVDFKDQEPVFKDVDKRPEFLISINFPTSQTNDAEATARAFLGVKHGSTYETLGIPNEEIAKKMGFGNYRKLRLLHATEKEKYPELALSVDQAAMGDNNSNTDTNNNQKVDPKAPKADAKTDPKKPVLKKRVITPK